MRRTGILLMAVGIAMSVASASPVALAAGKLDLIGSYRAWDAFTGVRDGRRADGGGRECYMMSMPNSLSPETVNHGEVYIAISHFPRLKRANEVSVIVGYNFQKDSEVRVGVGKQTFRMFVEGTGAWLRTPKEDRALVDAMRAGSSMVVRGVSSRGTKVSYRFSLLGFTAAHNAISEACN